MSGDVERYSKEDYLASRRRKMIAFIVSTALCITFAVLSMAINQYGLSLGEIFGIIKDHVHGNINTDDYREYIEDLIVFESYIPRAIACITAGAILGAGGAVMQSVIKNPLADSYTMGLSAGALLGVSCFVILGIGVVSGNFGLMANAFLFSLIPCGVVIVFSVFRNTTSNMIVFVGIAISFLFSAITTFINYTAAPEQLEEVYKWSIGSLGRLDPDCILFLIPSTIIMIVSLLFLADKIDITAAGDKYSKTLGVDAPRIRIVAILIVSLFTSITVCFVGTIGFIGLVIPNIVRIYAGSNSKTLIPISAIAGATLLLAADCVARMLIPGGFPVGFVTSLVGGPMMLFILMRRKNNAWGN